MLEAMGLASTDDVKQTIAPITKRMREGGDLLSQVISFYEARIQVERDFVEALSKLSQIEMPQTDVSTLSSAMGLVKADIANELSSRREFVTSLEEEVYRPLVQLRDAQELRNEQAVVEATQSVKQIRRERTKYTKVKTKYDKISSDRHDAENAIVSAQNASKLKVVRLTNRVNTTRKAFQEFKPKYDAAKAIWDDEEQSFDEGMTGLLTSLREQEENRVRFLNDCCLKTVVFTTNLNENRRYDVTGIAKQMPRTRPV